MRLVPHRVPPSMAFPHMEKVAVSRGRVSQVAVTPMTCPARAAHTHARVPRWRSAAPPAMIMVTMPSTAEAMKLPGIAPMEEKIDHQWDREGVASRVVNWSRHTQ